MRVRSVSVNQLSRILAKTELRGPRTSPRTRPGQKEDSKEPRKVIFVNSCNYYKI